MQRFIVEYYIDLSAISIDSLKDKLKTEDLLPSQQILREDMEERFRKIKSYGLKTVEDLKKALKTKKEVNCFALKTSLPADFLTVLRREINSYHPRPRKIKDFPGISDTTKNNLEKIGIKTTVDLFNRVTTMKKREALEKEIGPIGEEMLLLAKLTDLSRLRYVNETFAALLADSGYDSLQKIREADHSEMHKELISVNNEKEIFKGNFGLHDIRFLIREAAAIQPGIEL